MKVKVEVHDGANTFVSWESLPGPVFVRLHRLQAVEPCDCFVHWRKVPHTTVGDTSSAQIANSTRILWPSFCQFRPQSFGMWNFLVHHNLPSELPTKNCRLMAIDADRSRQPPEGERRERSRVSLPWNPIHPRLGPARCWGGARAPSGNSACCGSGAVFCRCARILAMTSGSSILAITLSFPPQRAHRSISMPNTRFRRCAQLIATWRGVMGLSGSTGTALPPTPRCAGVTAERSLLWGANTPWNRVRCIRGGGTSAASLAIRSSGSSTMCVVPSRYGALSV